MVSRALERAPTPAKAAHLRRSTVERLLKQHRIRAWMLRPCFDILRQPALKVAGWGGGSGRRPPALARRSSARCQPRARAMPTANSTSFVLPLARPGRQARERVERRDVAILKSLPGIGKINLATLLAEASGPLSRRDYQALRTLSGVAPVTKRSGKSHIVVMRYAAHVRLRNAVYHWARVATQHDPKSRTRYAALRKRGHSHGRAIRGVADRTTRLGLRPAAAAESIRSSLDLATAA